MRRYANGKGITGLPPKTKEERQKQLDKKFGKNEFKLLTYTDCASATTAKHKCGKIISSKRFMCLLAGDVKCLCSHVKIHKMTANLYKQQIKIKHGNKFSLVKFTGTGNSLNTYKHGECGKTFARSYESFKLSKHCPHCAGNFGSKLNTIPFETFIKRLDKKFPNQYVITNYTTSNNLANVKHVCGYSFRKKPSEILRWQHPVCYGCIGSRSIANRKEITLQGKTFYVQGFEPRALKSLVKKYGVDNVITGIKNVKRFTYKFKGKKADYYPDFMIKNKNLVIEVKSLATLGLLPNRYSFFGENVYERNCAKAKTVTKLGYKFNLKLYNAKAKKRFKLPNNWFESPKVKLAKRLNLNLS